MKYNIAEDKFSAAHSQEAALPSLMSAAFSVVSTPDTWTLIRGVDELTCTDSHWFWWVGPFKNRFLIPNPMQTIVQLKNTLLLSNLIAPVNFTGIIIIVIIISSIVITTIVGHYNWVVNKSPLYREIFIM